MFWIENKGIFQCSEYAKRVREKTIRATKNGGFAKTGDEAVKTKRTAQKTINEFNFAFLTHQQCDVRPVLMRLGNT